MGARQGCAASEGSFTVSWGKGTKECIMGERKMAGGRLAARACWSAACMAGKWKGLLLVALPREGPAKSAEGRGHRGEPSCVKGPRVATLGGGITVYSHKDRRSFQSGRWGIKISEADNEVPGVAKGIEGTVTGTVTLE